MTLTPPEALSRLDGLRHSVLDTQRGLPLLLEPASDAMKSPQAVVRLLEAEAEAVRTLMDTYGALLLRGFAIGSAMDFERVVRSFDPDQASSYLGTSPRIRLTDHVFTASELAWYYPIPQHCEMSFLSSAPARIYFHCMVAARQWGETPLVDFEAVAREMDQGIAQQFREKGIRNIRNYSGPSGGRASVTQTKPWHEMFGTTDPGVVEEKCVAEGLTPVWHGRDGLTLLNEQPAFITHPVSGREVWFNHALVFHPSTGVQETQYLAQYVKHPLFQGLQYVASALTWRDRHNSRPEDRGTDCTFGDGSPIPDAVMRHVRGVVWRNMVAQPWQRYDVVMLDNRRVSHGRRPYRGDRMVTVCWSQETVG